ncbi:MAG TPA: TMEM175 family protein [Ktedonobacteraceae bacterium]|nr:TMEM175 family protein [Ktedonobacteraceae bacterium]
MLRNQFIAKSVGLDKQFRLRGEDVSRIEAFSDAVFGFAVTLVVVSLQIPSTFDQLQQTIMYGFISFAICFAMLIGVWYTHYKFFRRYGLNDAFTIFLNMVLLFVILLYIYPLKFLFTLLTNSIFVSADNSHVIQNQQWPMLMILYGAGFIAVYTVFLLLYFHAYWKRQVLELNEVEINITRSSLLSTSIMICVGLASVLIAAVGGVGYVSLSGWIYIAIIPMHYISRHITQRFWKYATS